MLQAVDPIELHIHKYVILLIFCYISPYCILLCLVKVVFDLDGFVRYLYHLYPRWKLLAEQNH